MRFTHWLKNTVIISRMVAVSGDKIAMSTVTGIIGHIQPLSPEKAKLFDGVYGKAFAIWIDSSVDIEDGDRLKDENNNVYIVRKGGITRRNFGSFDYKKVIIEMTE